MKRTMDMTLEEVYNLMDSSDKIEEGRLCNYPSAVYIAMDEVNHIVAVGAYGECHRNSVQNKAISRGCLTPIYCMASRILTSEAIKSFNSEFEKSLKQRKISKN